MVNPALECLVAFLPQLDLAKEEAPRKKQKNSLNIPQTEFMVHTRASSMKVQWEKNLPETNNAAGYPLPAECPLKHKAKSTRPCTGKVSFGAASIVTFTACNNLFHQLTVLMRTKPICCCNRLSVMALCCDMKASIILMLQILFMTEIFLSSSESTIH